MTTFTAETDSVTSGYDTSTDPVTAAAKHLCQWRAGQARTLEALAVVARDRMPDQGQRLLYFALLGAGDIAADQYAHDIYIASCNTVGAPEARAREGAARHLTRLCRDAAHDIADQLARDNRICCDATKETNR